MTAVATDYSMTHEKHGLGVHLHVCVEGITPLCVCLTQRWVVKIEISVYYSLFPVLHR